MMLAILAYSITTGLWAFAYDWLSFALLARWWASPPGLTRMAMRSSMSAIERSPMAGTPLAMADGGKFPREHLTLLLFC